MNEPHTPKHTHYMNIIIKRTHTTHTNHYNPQPTTHTICIRMNTKKSRIKKSIKKVQKNARRI